MLPPIENITDRPPITAWQVERLRLTAFPSPAANFTTSNWWSDLVGEPAETSISQPKRGERQEEGPFNFEKLTLKIEPARIEWLFTSLNIEKHEDEIFPIIGSFPEVLDVFLPLMFRWFELETCPSLQRLAFGAILLQPVENRQAGYQRIHEYLPFIPFDPERSSDLLYQINRPRPSGSEINSLMINRLSKWSVSVLRSFEFHSGRISFPKQPSFACSLDLDINTSQDFEGELARTHLPQVFQELVNFGREIAIAGDIP